MIVGKPQLQAGLLTIVAGPADAVGYVAVGGVFGANMTGNTVLAGLSLGEGHFDLAAKRLAPWSPSSSARCSPGCCCDSFTGPACRCCSTVGREPALVGAVQWPLLVPAGCWCSRSPSAACGRPGHRPGFNCLAVGDNRNPKGPAARPGRAYSDASRTGCTVL
jgi:hypothetical protein